MIHGGAGAWSKITDATSAQPYTDAIRHVLEQGRQILRQGGSALEAVETCACLLEDNPMFNAGRGSVLNEDGKVEMDAAIMDGRDLSAGAVAAISHIANPIKLAQLVMTRSKHVMLIGDGAKQFAQQCGITLVDEDYFYTPERIAQLQAARLNQQLPVSDDKYGTIGAVARDQNGDLAAATSTGGTVNKRVGRVGDSPIIGAGIYADNDSCAVSATGHGEDLMRTVMAKTIADFISLQGRDTSRATQAAMEYLTRKVRGQGGVIVIDKNGHCASGSTTAKMLHGWIEKGQHSMVRF